MIKTVNLQKIFKDRGSTDSGFERRKHGSERRGVCRYHGTFGLRKIHLTKISSVCWTILHPENII